MMRWDHAVTGRTIASAGGEEADPAPDRRKAYGYIRVSSKRQADDGTSLDDQAAVLRGYARDGGWLMLGIGEDVGSAFHPGNYWLRHGLRSIVQQCLSQGVPLMVTRVDRFSRDVSILNIPGSDKLQILSIEDNCILTMKELRAKIVRAQEEVEAKRLGVESALENGRQNGKKLGNQKNLHVAQRKGTLTNMCKADSRAEDLLRLRRQHPELESLSWSKRTTALNALGSRNRTRKDDEVGKQWTRDALRGPWGRATTLRNEQEEFYVEAAEWVEVVEQQAEASRPSRAAAASSRRRASAARPGGRKRVAQALIRRRGPRYVAVLPVPTASPTGPRSAPGADRTIRPERRGADPPGRFTRCCLRPPRCRPGIKLLAAVKLHPLIDVVRLPDGRSLTINERP